MIAALLAWQAAAEVLSANELEKQLTRGPVIRKKVKIDVKDDYTSPETSAFISMPSILFVKGSAKLEPSSMRQLDEMAKALVTIRTRGPILRLKEKNNKEPVQVLIQGHTCDLGPEETNRYLSTNRAKSVRDYLIEEGAAPALLTTEGFGETRPAHPNVNESARQKNRRVDFVMRWHKDAVSEGTTGTRGIITTTTTSDMYLDVTFEALALSEGGGFYKNNDIDVLRSGDGIRIEFRVLEACHVYVLSMGSNGEVGWIFPANPQEATTGVWCYYDREYFLPQQQAAAGKLGFYPLEPPPGKETVFVIAAHEPVQDISGLPKVIEQYGPELTAGELRIATACGDAELHKLLIDHQ